MFERFTQEARAAVVDAQEVARRARADRVDAMHLLIALAEDRQALAGRALATLGVDSDELKTQPADGDLDANALASLGIDLDAVAAQVDRNFGPDALTTRRSSGKRSGHLPFSRPAKKTLEVSLREAIRLGDRGLDSGHLLLAVLRLDDTAAHRALVRALDRAGSDKDALRTALAEQRDGRAAS